MSRCTVTWTSKKKNESWLPHFVFFVEWGRWVVGKMWSNSVCRVSLSSASCSGCIYLFISAVSSWASSERPLVNNELRKTWQEAVLLYLRFCHCRYVAWMRKTVKNFSRESFWAEVRIWDLLNTYRDYSKFALELFESRGLKVGRGLRVGRTAWVEWTQAKCVNRLTFWTRNYFFSFSTPCI